MTEKRTFEQGMRRADRVEEKRNGKFTKGKASGGGRGRGRGGRVLGSGYEQDFPPLKPPVVERKGEVKFHAANEQKMREISDRNPTPPHLRTVTNKQKPKGKGTKDDEDHEEGGGVPVLDRKTAARLAALDDDDDDDDEAVREYFRI